MNSNILRHAAAGVLLASLAACGGGGSSMSTSTATPPSTSQSYNMPMVISDATSEDWATVGVQILSVALVPQSGANVTIYTAPTPAPVTNLTQLDNLGEIIGDPMVPAGTYVGAVITVSANPGDVTLITSSNPEAGFAAPAATPIDPAIIQILGATGTSGNLTVPINVKFVDPITVSSTQTTLLDLEFDLSHPAFIMAHNAPAADGGTIWAVNFDGPVRHHPMRHLSDLLLRHMYGNNVSIGTGSPPTTFTMTKDWPTYPAVRPETEQTTNMTLTISADTENGTIVYDVDGKQVYPDVKDFSTIPAVATLLGTKGEFVRVAARYQDNGTLVAVRIWASHSFNSIWVSPEGHVRHVDTTTDIITVDNEDGLPVQLQVTPTTTVFYRQPWNPSADAQPISMDGQSFLAEGNLVRGFKIHASCVDPLASPLVAQSIDIEVADYSGTISNANPMNFTYTRKFLDATDDYQVTLPYIDDSTPNGHDAIGNTVDGYLWWYFTFPTLAITGGSSAISAFESATNGAVSFGGQYGTVAAFGSSAVTWGDPANKTGWSARWTVLEPTPIPLGMVATGYNIMSASFGMSLVGNGNGSATVDVDTTTGSGTLVYEVSRAAGASGSPGTLTVTPIDPTSTAGQQQLVTLLVPGTLVKVWGVPQTSGESSDLKAYVLVFFTGSVLPAG